MTDINTLTRRANNIRKKIVMEGKTGGAAHFGGSLSCADILAVLYGRQMHYDIKNCHQFNRDRFVISKGHCSMALYAALCEYGFIAEDELLSFNHNNGFFPSHAVRNLDKGIELSSGSLGLGLSFALGIATAFKENNSDNKIYVLCGDGELNEGSLWESVMYAAHQNLNNICLIVDVNKCQIDGYCKDIVAIDNYGKKLEAFGWNYIEINGHDISEICKAFDSFNNCERPLAIIAHTVKGKGISFMENELSWHHAKMSDEQIELALQELEKGDAK